MKVFPAYVAGRFVKTETQKVLRAPYDGAPIGEISMCGAKEVEEALAAGLAAESAAAALPSYERSKICAEIAKGLNERKREIADGMVLESGKPVGDAEAEVDRAAHSFEVAAAEAERIYGEVIPLDLRPIGAGRTGILKRFPIGLVAGISPFNFPLNLAVHKIAPAIAAGCPIVLKPATQTPTSCLRLAEIVDRTSWPKGALSILPSAREAADTLVTDERPKLLSFTGSVDVGWDMKKRSGKKRVVLELGGDAAVYLDESADLDLALPKLIYGAFSYAGQKCISVQRIFVHKARYDEFLQRFTQATRELRVGDPNDRSVMVGPMIDEGNAKRVESWVDEAKKLGAKVLTGGARKGTVVEPTVLTDVPTQAKVSCEEVFGPTVNLFSVASADEAIARINQSKFGLQCAIFSRDLPNVMKTFEKVFVGAVIVNDAPSFRIDHMPYGGVKDSGFGREGLRWAIRDMTEERLLVI